MPPSLGGGRSHQQAEVAPKCREAGTFIAGYTLPGTAIFTIVHSSRLFVMLKRLIGGVGTERGGVEGAGGGKKATQGKDMSPLNSPCSAGSSVTPKQGSDPEPQETSSPLLLSGQVKLSCHKIILQRQMSGRREPFTALGEQIPINLHNTGADRR